MKINLDGIWSLYCCNDKLPGITSPKQLKEFAVPTIEGTVPGNVECDLVKAGIAKDPYVGKNAADFRKFEFYDWWYVRAFDIPRKFPAVAQLVFEGIDCFCEIFLDGVKTAGFDNAFISHNINVNLSPGSHELAVRIISPVNAVRELPVDAAVIPHMPEVCDSLWGRKPAHAYGWDITPRLICGGIWKSVYLEAEQRDTRFLDLYVETKAETSEKKANIVIHYELETKYRSLDGFMLKVEGSCGSSRFSGESPLWFVKGRMNISFDAPRLWWPYGYGEPNLYELNCKVYDKDGLELASEKINFGIRTIELDRNDMESPEQRGRFAIKINNVTIMAKGANWVPADALHSRDAERIPQILELFKELDCNIIRCWGGGVYEPDYFYDFCDRHGIMVWQDFAFACGLYPHNPEFFEKVRIEIDWVVKKLRTRTCIVLWCGDNECDQFCVGRGIDPNSNRINREIIPGIVNRLDRSRPYLPSSPYISPELYAKAESGGPQLILKLAPEQHIWGSREFFKLPFYAQSGAKFISETGWHGCPGLSSLEKFLSPEFLFPDCNNPEWDIHASNPFGKWSSLKNRNKLLFNQLDEYFTHSPENFKDFIIASQIFQAEAKKFMVENARLTSDCNGIIWWNVMDCWPQFSDAVVDYYFNKKLAFHYLKRSQKPFCIMFTEPEMWRCWPVAVNDTLETISGSVRISEAGSDKKTIVEDFVVAPNSSTKLTAVRAPRGSSRLFLIEWETSFGKGANHYISGNSCMSLTLYKQWLPLIAALDDSFNAEGVGE
jgi:beta-mannosidase